MDSEEEDSDTDSEELLTERLSLLEELDSDRLSLEELTEIDSEDEEDSDRLSEDDDTEIDSEEEDADWL